MIVFLPIRNRDSIHLKQALAQRTFAIAAKLGLITTSFAGQAL
jgi:hypothetical protein